MYSERIGLKTLNINEKIILNKKKLLNELNSNIKKYDKYLNEYSSANVSNQTGSEQIIAIIKKKYF